jgi:post-segregation antitoxin (ccd killing protein)
MRPKIYDDTAPRAPATVQINGDLHAKVQEVGLDIDAIAERALDAALREHYAGTEDRKAV